MQNADVNTAGVFGVRGGGWEGNLAFYTHTGTSGNTFGTTFTEKMRITDNGNVGIGNTAPSAKLEVQGTSTSSTYAGTGPTGTVIRAQANSGTPWITTELNGASAYIGPENSTTAKFAAYNYATSAEMNIKLGQSRMYIKSDGNVGIGTTSPTEKLHIHAGGIYSTPVTYAANQDNWGLKLGASNNAGWDYAGIKLRVDSTGSPRMALMSAGSLETISLWGGKVGIATASPDSRFTVNTTTTGDGIELQSSEVSIAKLSRAVVDSTVVASLDGVAGRPIHIGGVVNEDVILAYGGGKVTIGGPGGSTTGHLELYGRYSGSDPKLSFRSDHPTSGNTTVWDMARITADDGGNYNGVLHFQVAAGNGSNGSGAALATAMTIQDTKYVGIGTTSPDTNLEVDIKNGADGNGIHITSTSTTNDPTLKLTRNGSADRFQFMVRGGAGSARLGISAGTNLDSGLNLGSNNGLSIGTTTAAGSGGLLVDNDIKSNSRFGVGSGGSLSDAAIYKNSDTNTGIYWPGADQIALTTAGSNRLHISSNGGVSLNSQSQLTTGGNARLSIIDSSVQLSMGASNNDMAYIRKQGAGQFAWQTYNSGNSGILQLQPYGGNVTINTTAAVSSHALSVSGRIGGLTYSDSYVQFTGGNAILKANDDVVIGYSSYVYVKQAGKVGLGTSDPKAEFQVYHAGIDTYSVNTSATSAAQVDTFSATEFRSARFTVQITNTTDSTYQITEILLIHDGTTPSMTEYGTIFTGSAREASFDADIVSGNVRLLATPASSDSMQFKVVRHSILV